MLFSQVTTSAALFLAFSFAPPVDVEQHGAQVSLQQKAAPMAERDVHFVAPFFSFFSFQLLWRFSFT
jgi:hypothetical protein